MFKQYFDNNIKQPVFTFVKLWYFRLTGIYLKHNLINGNFYSILLDSCFLILSVYVVSFYVTLTTQW